MFVCSGKSLQFAKFTSSAPTRLLYAYGISISCLNPSTLKVTSKGLGLGMGDGSGVDVDVEVGILDGVGNGVTVDVGEGDNVGMGT